MSGTVDTTANPEQVTVTGRANTTPTSSAAPYYRAQVFPYEGGTWTITPTTMGVVSVQTSKSISTAAGDFAITLVATGPQGQNTRPLWSDIITPMSMCVIEMGRGRRQGVVMIGVVVGVAETTAWTPQGPQRQIVVSGKDFGYIFAQYAYYNLTYLLGLPQAALGELGAAQALAAPNSHIAGGTPAQLGQAWYEMMTSLVMSKLQMNYNGQMIPFSSFVATQFEEYPSTVTIPMGSNFLADEADWYTKFNTFFQMPWYEFFVTTAPVNHFDTSGNSQQFNGWHAPAANVNVVARVNPLPKLTSATALDMTAWSALPLVKMDPGVNAYADGLSWSAEGARNLYAVYPQSIAKTIGVDNSNINPFAMSTDLWVDPASIGRYGFRPEIVSTYWFWDGEGVHAQQMASAGQSLGEFQTLMTALTLQVASYYEPLPLMASGTVSMPLRPDVVIGSRFQFTPTKATEPWMFYVVGVAHDIGLGRPAVTTLSLVRGLPLSVYQNQALLTAIHAGNAQRQGGTFTQGLPQGSASPLENVPVTARQGFANNLQPIFNGVQSGQQPP